MKEYNFSLNNKINLPSSNFLKFLFNSKEWAKTTAPLYPILFPSKIILEYITILDYFMP